MLPSPWEGVVDAITRRLAVGVASLLLLTVAAPVHAGPAAPQDLEGSYDAPTETVTVTWAWTGSLGPGDAFRVYIDGALAATTTGQSYEDDVSTWLGGVRAYQVSVVVDDEESSRAGPLVVNGYLDVGQCTQDGHFVIDPGSLPPGTAPDEVVIACLRSGDPQAPYNLTASYDPTADALTLAWLHADPASVSEYRVYRNGEHVATTTDMDHTDDLTDWDGSPRTYTVAAVIDGEEHESDPTTILAGPDIPLPFCSLYTVGLRPYYPFVVVGLYPECLPPIPPV